MLGHLDLVEGVSAGDSWGFGEIHDEGPCYNTMLAGIQTLQDFAYNVEHDPFNSDEYI